MMLECIVPRNDFSVNSQQFLSRLLFGVKGLWFSIRLLTCAAWIYGLASLKQGINEICCNPANCLENFNLP